MEAGLNRTDSENGTVDPARFWRRSGAIFAAVVVFVGIFFLRREGILDGIFALAFGVLLAALIPWSSSLSRRILLSGAMFLGWIPLLWWVRLPVPEVDRMGIVLALASAALVGWILWGPDVSTRAKRLYPRLEAVDSIPVAAGGLAVWATWPMITTQYSAGMLNLLIRSAVDHASHLSMVMQTRTQGAIVPFLGQAPDGSDWTCASYPQHFHAANTALTELGVGPAVGDVTREALMYGRSLALIQVLIAVLLAAGVAQLPRLRRRPLLAWPVAAMVVAPFILGPGSQALSDGRVTLTLACATAGLAALLGTAMSGKLRPVHIFALGGLVVATVHCWALLAPMAAIGAATAFVPLGRERWPRRRTTWAWMAAGLLLTLAASAAVIPLLISSGGVEILNVGWQLEFKHFWESTSLVVLVVCPAIAVSLLAFVRGRTRESSQKGLALAATAGTGLLTLVAVAAYEYVTAGVFGYYFRKLELGVTLVAFVLLAGSVAVNVAPSSRARGRGRVCVAIIATLFAVVGALQVQSIEGVRYRDQATWQVAWPTEEAPRLFEAATLAQSRPFGSTFYMGVASDDAAGPAALERYFYALSGSYTTAGLEVEAYLRDLVDRTDDWDMDDTVLATTALLTEYEHRTAIVAPEVVDPLRSRLPEDLRERVITWDGP